MSERCIKCGEPVMPGAAWKKAEGWIPPRTRGTNQLALKKEIGEYMHRSCMIAAQSGAARGQEPMF